MVRCPPSPFETRHSASLRAFTPVFDGLWTRVNALMALLRVRAGFSNHAPLLRTRTANG
jgi:hypothetical protein